MKSKLQQKEITVEISGLGILIVLEEWEVDIENQTCETYTDKAIGRKTHELTGLVTITITGKRVR